MATVTDLKWRLSLQLNGFEPTTKSVYITFLPSSSSKIPPRIYEQNMANTTSCEIIHQSTHLNCLSHLHLAFWDTTKGANTIMSTRICIRLKPEMFINQQLCLTFSHLWDHSFFLKMNDISYPLVSSPAICQQADPMQDRLCRFWALPDIEHSLSNEFDYQVVD